MKISLILCKILVFLAFEINILKTIYLIALKITLFKPLAIFIFLFNLYIIKEYRILKIGAIYHSGLANRYFGVF